MGFFLLGGERFFGPMIIDIIIGPKMKKQKKKIVKISIFKNLKRVFVRTIGKEIQENLEVAF